jgi:hypothetical protein
MIQIYLIYFLKIFCPFLRNHIFKLWKIIGWSWNGTTGEGIIFCQLVVYWWKNGGFLTFGTDLGQFPNYQFNDAGNPVYYQDGCSVYMLHNLIANFSDRCMLFQNKTFDITNEYKRFAQKFIFLHLYQDME